MINLGRNKDRAVLWDFDGVILDSAKVRDKGFEMVLDEYPDKQVEKLMAFHRANGGLSRYVKFRYFFEEIRNEQISEREVQECANRFSKIMMNNLVNEKLLIHETVDFIKKHCEKFNMHIVSGSDQNELRRLCNKLGIDTYFISINGSPTPKKKLVNNLLKQHTYDNRKVMLIGDSINDYEAAKENEISFLGYNNRDIEKLTDENLFENFPEVNVLSR